MFSKQKLRKTAFILLLVALISLIPSNTFIVFASGDIVPPFPYDEIQTIGKNNYLLFKVHGVDEVDFVECIIPGRGIHGAFDSTLSGLSYSSLGGWVLQINAIDYCFKNGQKVDFDLQDIFTTSFMPVDNDDPYYSAWLEFVYTSTDVWGVDEDEISGYNVRFYKAQNFIIEPAATPTPTPVPDVGPSDPIPDNDLIDGSDLLFLFKVIDDSNIYYNQYVGMHINFMQNWLNTGGKIYLPYFHNYDGGVSCTIKNAIFFWKINGDNPLFYFDRYGNEVPSRDNLNNYIDRVSFDNLLNAAWGFSSGGQAFGLLDGYSFLAGSGKSQSLFEIVAFNHVYENNLIINYDSSVSPTPTPTTAPTPIPQPSTTPAPEDPDKNSSWGWGIVNTLKYIFIPDKNKLIRLEKTAQTKFQQFGGGYDDLKHVSGFENPVRPQNVIMNWHPFSTSDEEQPEQEQQITIVDFEQIDFYLFQTPSGMFICECLKASFTFLMFGYLIHVIRKHFVIENTSSDDSNEGGD